MDYNEVNMPMFIQSNIVQYNKLGYSGKGVKIIVLEVDNLSHSIAVYDMIKQIAPDAEITRRYMNKDSVKKTMQEAIDNKVHLINCSFRGSDFRQYYNMDDVFKKIFICASAGNSGKEDDFYPAAIDKCLSVGAIDFAQGLKPYSTHSQKLDIVNFSGVWTSEGYMDGTSFSSPYTVGMLALFIQAFTDKFIRNPTTPEINKYILENCTDLMGKGFDIKTGNGLFRLNADLNKMSKVETIDSRYTYLFDDEEFEKYKGLWKTYGTGTIYVAMDKAGAPRQYAVLLNYAVLTKEGYTCQIPISFVRKLVTVQNILKADYEKSKTKK